MPSTAFYPFRSESAKAEYETYCSLKARTWAVPFETTVIDTPSASTLARVSGQAGDPTLVLLPGARSTSLMWTEMVAPLSAHHRTYALDIAGDAGFSVHHTGIVAWADFTEWLHEVLDVIAPTQPVRLLGMSLGGAIAAHYAVRHPERVRGVVLVAPGATVLPFSTAFFVRFALLSLRIRAGGRSRLRRTCEWLFEDALRGDAPTRARAERAIDEAQRVVRVFGLRPPPWPAVLSDAEWRDFAPPCLFLVGEREKIYSARTAIRRLQRVAPQVTAEIVSGAGHDITLVRPQLVAQRAAAFFAALPSASVEPVCG